LTDLPAIIRQRWIRFKQVLKSLPPPVFKRNTQKRLPESATASSSLVFLQRFQFFLKEETPGSKDFETFPEHCTALYGIL